MQPALNVGDVALLTAVFRDAGGNPSDPTSVTLQVHKPNDATPITVPTTRTGVGTYQATIALDQAGVWRYRWTSTGTPTVAEGGDFLVTEVPI